MEFTLLWAALTGVVFMWLGTRFWPDGLPDHAFDLLIGAAVLGLAVGRVVAMVIQGTNPLSDPGALLIVRGGVHTGAAAIAAAGFLGWSVRGQLTHLDALAPIITLGLGGWHAGCVWTGSCLGTASGLPWAWSLAGSDVTRHPVELYAAIGLISASALISRLSWRPFLKSGATILVLGLVRIATEPLRRGFGTEMAWWYGAGALLGLAILFLAARSTAVATPT